MFSSRNWIVVQFTRSLSRDWPDWITGDLWPRISPAVTTAMMPEPWNSPTSISSAGTYAAKGTRIEIAVSNTGWVIRRRIGITTRATSRPDRHRHRAAIRKPPVTSAAETAPPMADDRHPEAGDRRGVVDQRLALQDGDQLPGQPDPAGDRGGRHGVRRGDHRAQRERHGEVDRQQPPGDQAHPEAR